MMLDFLTFAASVLEEIPDVICKFCYGDEVLSGWLRPCKCSGTLRYVHRSCFEQWMKKAPSQQQSQCQTCRHYYDKKWMLKPFSDWQRPPMNLSAWECFEIFLDVYSTYKFFRGFVWTLEGRRSIWVQILHFLFWRTFIATNRRLLHYRALGIRAMGAVFEIRISDYKDESETPAVSPVEVSEVYEVPRPENP